MVRVEILGRRETFFAEEREEKQQVDADADIAVSSRLQLASTQLIAVDARAPGYHKTNRATPWITYSLHRRR